VQINDDDDDERGRERRGKEGKVKGRKGRV